MSLELNRLNLYCVGTSFQKADATARGKFSLSRHSQTLLLDEAKENGLEGILVLSTCNRTEITAFAENADTIIDLLCKYSKGSAEEFSKISTVFKNEDAVNHFFRLGSGLESQILGDYEIIGQLRNAFRYSKEHGATNAYFERLMNSVTQASKQVKNETKLSSGTTSVSYAAVQFIMENYPDYDAKNILLFGLGKIGRHTCQNLAEHTDNRNVSLINRSEDKLNNFIDKYPFIRKASFMKLADEVHDADILIVSTGADSPTITQDHILKGKELIILDLSMPANVSSEVGNMENVTLVNVDKLSRITDKTLSLRQGEVQFTEEILRTHENEFLEWASYRRFTPALTAFKESLHLIKQDEINFHKKKTENFNVSQAEIISSRLIQKITSQFAKHLKEDDASADQSIALISKVFGIADEQSN
tara:strand:- start:7507 stop:8763 length:1257 start_codon:yes stop_codon:yes gene_type:complete